MSHITKQNPIRYTLDEIKSGAYALVIAKNGNELDCTNASSITGFKINYSQSNNTKIAIAFTTGDKIDPRQKYPQTSGMDGAGSTSNGAWFKLNSSGYAVEIDTQAISYDSLIEEGNTISELLALTSIPAFKGYKVRVAIALYSQDIKSAVPAISLAVKAVNSTQTTQRVEYSPVYELGAGSQILSLNAKTELSNNGSIILEGDINESGTWRLLGDLQGREADTLQLRATMNAPEINSSTVKLNEINMIYSHGTGIINGEGVCEIISQTHNWYKNIRHARVRVKHAPLINSSMKVYAAFRSQPKEVVNESLGTGDGSRHTYQLKQVNRVKFDSVRLYFDGAQTTGNFEVNGEIGRITCTAPAGSIITCSYQYDWDLENWQELTKTGSISKPEYDESEYYLRSLEANNTVCAVKIALHMKTGSTSNEVIGTGKGKEYTYKLAHKVKDGNLTITANNVAVNKANYYLLYDSQYVKIAAVNGQTLRANYDWISETPTVYEFHAVFSE